MKQARNESVGGLLAGISLDGLAGEGTVNARHPLGEEFGYEVSEEHYLLDPKRIVLEGPYVREWIEDEDFEAFCHAVAENGDIGQAIGIRTIGSLLEKRHVLVYGMRRWKAALRAGLPKIPVRDYGEISDEESLALQMIENEARADPHPVDTAFGYYLLVKQGRSQTEVARTHGKTQPYVSYMRAVGEAIAGLEKAERLRLYGSPAVTVRAFQEIAKLPDPEDRRRELLRLASDQPSPIQAAVARRAAQETQAFQAQALRGGRSFRMRWRDEDLRADPVGFAEAFHTHITEEYQRLAERLRNLERQQRRGGKGTKAKPADPDALASAADRLETALAEMRQLLAVASDQSTSD